MPTTHFPNGITTTTAEAPFGNFILPNPLSVHSFFDDFNFFTAAEWTENENGDGMVALVVSSDGGSILMTTAGTEGNDIALESIAELFLMEAGKQAWFEARITPSEGPQVDWFVGLRDKDSDPFANDPDGIFFSKADEGNDVLLTVKGAATLSQTVFTEDLTATAIQLSFYFNGDDKVTAFVNGVAAGSVLTATTLPTSILALSFGIQTGDASVETLNVDYVYAAKER